MNEFKSLDRVINIGEETLTLKKEVFKDYSVNGLNIYYCRVNPFEKLKEVAKRDVLKRVMEIRGKEDIVILEHMKKELKGETVCRVVAGIYEVRGEE